VQRRPEIGQHDPRVGKLLAFETVSLAQTYDDLVQLFPQPVFHARLLVMMETSMHAGCFCAIARKHYLKKDLSRWRKTLFSIGGAMIFRRGRFSSSSSVQQLKMIIALALSKHSIT
jgi:hypothetical protein